VRYELERINGGFRSLVWKSKAAFIVAVGTGLALSHTGSRAFGADLEWSGRYRVEGNYIKNYTLDSSAGVEDSYIIHHLIMEPKIVASDGLNIKARFDVFNNALNNDQHGQVFGDYSATPGGAAAPAPPNDTTTPQAPGVLTTSQTAESIVATELYLNWVNEFGALVAGRVPFNFGLGMLYNDGSGLFDHSISTKDIVGYKLVLGNLSIMPAYGKVREGNLLNEDDINDYIIMAEYNNPETDFSMGFLFDQRVAPFDAAGQGNDFPATTYFSQMNANFGPAQLYDGYSAYNMNFYVKKKWEDFNLGIEVGFLNGYSGAKVQEFVNGAWDGNLDRVNMAGFGGALELGYRTGKIKLNLRAGLASGDDPDTTTLESYAFSPNYHVAFMMFSYPMGNFDALRSSIWGGTPAAFANGNQALANLAGLDTEMITNAMYFAPNLTWTLGDRYDLLGTFCYANAVKPPVSPDTPPAGLSGYGATSLGFETDFGLNYHPNDKFTWETDLGVFFPGAIWQGGGGYHNNMAYGATSKAAVNF
jgi:hypothetical protein